jgi:hypothetical protein
VDPQQVGWAYKIGVARSLAEISPRDAAFLAEELTKQATDKREYPLSGYERKLVEGKRTVDLPTGQAVVEIPSDEEGGLEADGVITALAEHRRSIKVQSRLVEIGVQLGFKIWLPANDRGGVLDVLGNQWSERRLKRTR